MTKCIKFTALIEKWLRNITVTVELLVNYVSIQTKVETKLILGGVHEVDNSELISL